MADEKDSKHESLHEDVESRANEARHVERSVQPANEQCSALQWSGEKDPENPQNWSRYRKAWQAFVPGLLAFIATLASSIYTSGYQETAHDLNISSLVALLGLSLYCIGLGVGQLFASAFSEAFGRWIVYVVSATLFGLFALGAGFARTAEAEIVTRTFAGLTAGPLLSVGPGTIADLYSVEERAVVTSVFVAAPFLGPIVGPIIGGFVVESEDWRWLEWVVLFALLPTLLLLVFTTNETFGKAILSRQAKRRGARGPSAGQISKQISRRLFFMITHPAKMILTEPIVLVLGLYSAFIFAVTFAFFASYPVVYGEVYHFTDSQTGLAFVGLAIGNCLAITTNIMIDRYIYQKKLQRSTVKQNKPIAPENRLYSATIGSIGIPIGLFWFGWTARPDIHWIVPAIGSVVFAWGTLCVFLWTAAVVYTIDTYGPANAASAMAANGVIRYLGAAGLPLCTTQMYHALGIGWATSVLGFVSIALVAIPWVLFACGPWIRRRSALAM